ncbi:hypothetical protein G6F65_018992 [Rhizopus arrhizus]|nr:hypothetical protein G6F65_018992 [Rhizopus arrhizus]
MPATNPHTISTSRRRAVAVGQVLHRVQQHAQQHAAQAGHEAGQQDRNKQSRTPSWRIVRRTLIHHSTTPVRPAPAKACRRFIAGSVCRRLSTKRDWTGWRRVRRQTGAEWSGPVYRRSEGGSEPHLALDPVEHAGVLRRPAQFLARLVGADAAVGTQGVGAQVLAPARDRVGGRPGLCRAQAKPVGDGAHEVAERRFASAATSAICTFDQRFRPRPT